ncbi:MAG TPA: PASTA domain-containing protein [Terriglobia bacterium]|nr:PASTA domain-containing protein [Terriglobia bacterium]
MRLVERIKTLSRIFFLFTVLVCVALLSAITTIRLTIKGNEETLPNLVGMNLDSAQALSSSLGLVVKVEDKLFTEKFPSNDVISQLPSAGTRVKVGQHVHVLVSLGAQRVVVPDLIGSSLRVAQILAVQKGLTVGDMAEVYSNQTEDAQILAQEPPPSSTEVRSPAVNFLVSLGEKPAAVLCPNFVGMLLPQARQQLDSSGYKVGKVTPTPPGAVASGTILAQSPTPGSKISPGDTFDFQVAP